MYINDIVHITCKILGLFKKFEFSWGRVKLSKIYLTFLGLILEYASVVENGSSFAEIKKVKKVHAAEMAGKVGLHRIVAF